MNHKTINMEFLLTKERSNRSNQGISIGKSGLSIKGESFERLFKNEDLTKVRGNIGINAEGNLAVYISYAGRYDFHKFFKQETKVKSMRLDFGKEAKKLIPYRGDYEIKYISMKEGGLKEIKEVVLKRV